MRAEQAPSGDCTRFVAVSRFPENGSVFFKVLSGYEVDLDIHGSNLGVTDMAIRVYLGLAVEGVSGCPP